MKTVSMEDVYDIRFSNSKKGLWEGAGVGLLTGALTGLLVGLARGGSSDNQLAAFSAEENAIVGTMILGLEGVIIGIPIGLSVKHKDIYQMEKLPFKK